MTQPSIIIRPFKIDDKDSVRKICADTAFMGEPVERFFDFRDIFSDIAISYYTDYEPESLFIAECDGNVVGYLAGCKDTRRFKRIFSRRILPRAFFSLLVKGAFFREKSARLITSILKSFFKGELRRPDYLKDFPAHLHVNVQNLYRHIGAGTKLMERYFDYLRNNHIGGVHLYSFSSAGQQFFQKLDFSKVFSQKVSYFEQLKLPEVYLYGFTKRIG